MPTVNPASPYRSESIEAQSRPHGIWKSVWAQAVFFSPLVILLSVVGPSNVQAENEMEQPLNELFQTDAVYPQDEGELQLTLVPVFGKGQERNSLLVPVVMEYGLTDAWQVELEWTTFSVLDDPATQGIGDLELGTMYSFMNIDHSPTHAALGFELGIPLGDVNDELSEGFLEYQPFVILARDFPQLHRLQLFTQLRFSFVQRVNSPKDSEEKEPAAHEIFWNAGLFVPHEQFVYTVEFNWLTNKWNHHGEENQQYLTPGLKWVPSPTWEFGVGAPVGLNANSDDYRIILHFLYEMDLF